MRGSLAVLLPLAVAVVLDGVAFGVLARAGGFAPVAAVSFSVLAVTGSGQLAALSVLQTGGGAVAAGLTVLLLNARCIAMGIAVAPVLGGRLWRRVLAAQLVFDESWTLGQVTPGRWDKRLLLATGAAVYISWVVGTVVGVVGAAPLGDARRLGIDAIFPAFFLALLVRCLSSRQGIIAAALGASIALALTPWTAPGVPILAASAGCLVAVRR